jgi:hypothetical protein
VTEENAQAQPKEAPLTRQEKLRRVVILCCHCSRNFAYYRSGWKPRADGPGHKPFFAGDFGTTVNGNFIDVAVLEWCKLFGDATHESHHWTKIFDTAEKQKNFSQGLLAYVGCSKKEWKSLRNKALSYRNEFLAHLGEKRGGDLPFVSFVLRSAMYYHRYLMKHENDGQTYGTLPPDPEGYHAVCVAEGLRYYKRPRRDAKSGVERRQRRVLRP